MDLNTLKPLCTRLQLLFPYHFQTLFVALYLHTSLQNFCSYLNMTFLILGGTGKTSTRLASLLAAAQKTFLLASRRGQDATPHGYPAIKFDWAIESTWSSAFDRGHIEAIYMMEPQFDQPWVPMIKFIDLARQKGVKRFVLCAGTTAALGKDGMGRVWEHFVNCGVDYCVLRPSWFMGACSHSNPKSVSG